MNRKPLIAIVCNRFQHPTGYMIQPDDIGINYVQAIVRAGGLPFLIPIDYPLENIRTIRSTFDGLLLTGGGDIETARYGGKEHPSVCEVCPQRDELEFRLTKLAFETDWPIMGICRGIQIMNVAMGGKIYSDIDDQYPNPILHHYPFDSARDALVHQVILTPGSLIAEITGCTEIGVNSFHHQAVSEPAPCFEVIGRAEDGIIESVMVSSHPFALGVQWHPEFMETNEIQNRLFSAFVNACGKE